MDTQTNLMTQHNSTQAFNEIDASSSPFKHSAPNHVAKPTLASDNSIEVSNTYTAPSYNDCDCETDAEYSEYLSETNQFLAF